MAHLGDDVAAFVDGQLSGAAMQDASAHLEHCEACERAVRQQRLLKSRMSTVEAPAPPAALLASLAGLASAPPPPRERWLARMGRLVPVRLGLVLVSASLAVVAAAYAMGGAEPSAGDEVAPAYDGYVADFLGATTVNASVAISDHQIQDLEASGWPCHETLAGTLHRTSGMFLADGQSIALDYSDGQSKLKLVEQTGVLDRQSLTGFTSTRLAGAKVWVREGNPMIVTWDEQGTVYTVITDVDRARVAQVVSQLPHGHPTGGPIERVGDGFSRMTAWINAA